MRLSCPFPTLHLTKKSETHPKPRAIALELPLLHIVPQRGGASRSERSKEAGHGRIPQIFQGGQGSLDQQRDAPRLSRDADGRAAFEPVRRPDLRRHGGFRRPQRMVSAPVHASGARSSRPRRLLPTVPDDGSGSVRGRSVLVRFGLGEGSGGGGASGRSQSTARRSGARSLAPRSSRRCIS